MSKALYVVYGEPASTLLVYATVEGAGVLMIEVTVQVITNSAAV